MKETLSRPLISIIMPAYNACAYISEAIESVLFQSWPDFELIVINDGSLDDTESAVLAFDDRRIRYFSEAHAGVSAARNVGLKNMTGDFFCFLDADDRLPSDSLEARLNVFLANPAADFVDGKVIVYDADMRTIIDEFIPSFSGNPLRNLLRLNSCCFFGPTWMIRRDHALRYQMKESVSHCEDILFYMELARRKSQYVFTTSVILHYRRHGFSAMRQLERLHKGYQDTFRIIKEWPENNWRSRLIFVMKVKKIMCLSYWARGQYQRALRALWV